MARLIFGTRTGLTLLSIAFIFTSGCRGNPVRAVFTLVGEAVDAADLKQRAPQLIGKGPDAADAMFGHRFDTLEDQEADSQWLLYLEEDAHSAESRYLVEVKGGRIVALYKTMQNVAGAADSMRADVLKARLARKTPREAEQELNLGRPQLSVSSRRTDRVYLVYDTRRLPQLEGARYCVLEFDTRNLCVDVRLVGVTASTKAPPSTSS